METFLLKFNCSDDIRTFLKSQLNYSKIIQLLIKSKQIFALFYSVLVLFEAYVNFKNRENIDEMNKTCFLEYGNYLLKIIEEFSV